MLRHADKPARKVGFRARQLEHMHAAEGTETSINVPI